MCLACSRAEASGKPVAAPIEAAAQLLEQRKPDAAMALLAPTVTDTQAKITAARAKGKAYCARDQTEALLYLGIAAAAKTEAVVLGPDQCMALYLTAYALNETRHTTEAVTLLQQLVELSPGNAQYAIELGFTLRASGDLAKAKAAYEQALAAAELTTDLDAAKFHRAAARRGLGYLLIEAGDLDGAEAMYRKSLEDQPDSPVAKAELDFIRQQRTAKPAT